MNQAISLFIVLLFLSSCATTVAPSNSSSNTSKIFLVRHAEKASDGTKDPPLTAEGIERAENLASMLEKENITRIYSTNYKRTMQTATPLARSLRLPIAFYDASDLPAFAQSLQGSRENILIVGHSNSTPSLANLILGEEQYVQFDESDYENLITINVQGRNTTGKLSKMK